MEILYFPVQHTLIADSDISAASARIENNDMAVSSIEKVNHPRVTWLNDKLQQIINMKVNAEFELSVAEAELENLSSSMEFCYARSPYDLGPRFH